MTRNIRRLIASIFIITFLITAPLLILYAMGYRFDIKKQKIQSVGALFLDSYPKTVQIKLNGKTLKQSMPAKIINLLPNSYSISIEKDGYHKWSKELSVNSKQTTFSNNVILFQKSLPQSILESKINIFKSSTDFSKILYSTIDESWEEIWLMNTDSPEQKQLLYRTSLSNKNILKEKNIWWSSDNNKILIYNEKDYFILDSTNTKNILFINDISQTDLTNVKWDARSADQLYGINKKDIYSITLSPLSTQKITSIPLDIQEYSQDYLVKNGSLYYINQGEQSNRLEQVSIEENAIPQYLIEIEKDTNFIFSYNNERFISLQNKVNEVLYLIKVDQKIPEYEILNAKDLIWNNKNSKILYFNSFELFSSDANKENKFIPKYLLTRLSNGIQNSIWHNESEHVFFTTESSLNVIELDGRDYRNTNQLLTDIHINQISQNQDSTILFFHAVINNKEGIYSLKINESKTFLEQTLGL